MKITKVDTPTFTIEGLDRETAIGLLSITGKFADNVDSGSNPHWHTRLYRLLRDALPEDARSEAARAPLYGHAEETVIGGDKVKIGNLHCAGSRCATGR